MIQPRNDEDFETHLRNLVASLIRDHDFSC